ncbi:uncharacterized protein LOC141718814 [Apium graveolens]|uniref:uncharacterized protein LOC141718814 n=1 Tax=Apium graveolens TaxID=4045 RepID=UPI003D7A1263
MTSSPSYLKVAFSNVSTSANIPFIDASHPYYLHPSNHPGLILITITLNEQNYNKWFRSMKVALSSKLKLGFMDGTYDKPVNATLLLHWNRCNDIVISWILNTGSSEIHQSVMYMSSAKDIWDDVSIRFAQTNVPKFISNKLSQCLMGLSEQYTAIRGHLLLMTVNPSLSAAYSLLLQEENQRELGYNPYVSTLSQNCLSADKWILDSGVTDHITPHFKLLTDVYAITTVLHLSNGCHTPVTHAGTVHLHKNIVLTDVLYVPTFTYNLLSIPKLTSTNSCAIVFNSNAYYIQDHILKKIIEIGELQEGLYLFHNPAVSHKSLSVIPLSKSQALCNSVPSPSVTNSLLWHARLGHPSISSIKFLPKSMCLYFATDTTPHKDKFSNRSIKCVFFGYPFSQKAYRVMNFQTKRVFVSRDVLFNEHIFPFKKEISVSSPAPYLFNPDVIEFIDPISDGSVPDCIIDSPPLDTSSPPVTSTISSVPSTSEHVHTIDTLVPIIQPTR